MNVVTIGVGYVGLNTAVALAYIGHTVRGVDVDARKIDLLKQRKAPISEAGLDNLLTQQMDLRFTTSLAEVIQEADIIFIAVGTPSLPNGHANLAYVESAANDIGKLLQPSHDVTIVVKSTVPVGINSQIERQIRESISARGGNTSYLHFASNPEFLREGRAVYDNLQRFEREHKIPALAPAIQKRLDDLAAKKK